MSDVVVNPCRHCKEPTDRLSRICTRCVRKNRDRNNLRTYAPKYAHQRNPPPNPDNLMAYFLDHDEDTKVKVAEWFGRRTVIWAEVEAALPSLRSRCNTYGITVSEWVLRVMECGSACEICRKKLHPLQLHTDHDHQFGYVRGLLCNGCNTGLGLLGVDGAAAAPRLRAALRYIENGSQKCENVPAAGRTPA